MDGQVYEAIQKANDAIRKADYNLGRLDIIEKKLDLYIDAVEAERAERSRLSATREQSIINEATKKIEEKFAQLGTSLDEKIDLYLQAKTAEQCSDIDSLSRGLEDIRIKLDSIDTRTRDFPLMKGKVELLETRPGLMAIKAWQWVAVSSVGIVGIGLTIYQIIRGLA